MKEERIKVKRYVAIFSATDTIADSIINDMRDRTRLIGLFTIDPLNEYALVLRFRGGVLGTGDLANLVKAVMKGRVDWPLLKHHVDEVLKQLNIEKTMKVIKQRD